MRKLKIHYTQQAIIAGLATTTACLLIGGLQAVNFFPQIAITSTILYFIIFKNIAVHSFTVAINAQS